MAIKIKNKDPKTTDFAATDLVINRKEGTLFFKSDSSLVKLGSSEGGWDGSTNVTLSSEKILDVSAGILTLANNQISGDKVEGGTIAATTISTLTTTSVILDGNTITGINDSDEFTDDDAHIMTSAAINDKFAVINADTTGLAGTATTLATTRALQVTLSETDSSNFNGSTDVTDIGVTGTLAVGNGGTGVGSMTNLKNELDGETWTFVNNVTLPGIVLDGNTITGINDASNFTDDDAHIMTSAAINNKFAVINADTTGNAATITITDNENTDEENVITFVAGEAGSGNVGLEADGDLTYNPSTGAVSASGDVYSNNFEILKSMSARIDKYGGSGGSQEDPAGNNAAAGDWWGSDVRGYSWYNWDKNYGDDTQVLSVSRLLVGSSIIVPYKCQLVGFKAIVSYSTSWTTTIGAISVALYTGAGDAATFNDTSGQAADLTIVQRSVATTVTVDTLGNPMTLSVTNGTTPLDVGDLVFPRIKSSTATADNKNDMYATIDIIIKRAK
tara:strand:+ start:2793 stop:4304 length:1512 start_codon:yes stop_codon:yes gene_type:complete